MENLLIFIRIWTEIIYIRKQYINNILQIYISNKKKKIILKLNNMEITKEIRYIIIYNIIEKLKITNSIENNNIIIIRKLYNRNIIIKMISIKSKQKLKKYIEFKIILDDNIYIVYKIFTVLIYNIYINMIDIDNQIIIIKKLETENKTKYLNFKIIQMIWLKKI